MTKQLHKKDKVIKKYLRDGGSSAQSVASWILNDRELVRVGLPDVLRVVVVLGCDYDLVSHQEGGVEADSELANQLRGGLAFCLHLGHPVEELAGARLGNSSQVLHKFLFGHANASVSDVKHVLLLVRLVGGEEIWAPFYRLYLQTSCSVTHQKFEL